MSKFDLAVIIGRFQPFHNGHLQAVAKAATVARKVLILVGSAYGPRTIKNPFTYEERKTLITQALWNGTDRQPLCAFEVMPLSDYRYDDNLWMQQVQETVEKSAKQMDAKKVCLVGHAKDESAFYLNFFPQWPLVDSGHIDLIDASKIRKLWFENDRAFLKSVLNEKVLNLMLNWEEKDPGIKNLIEEWKFIQAYKKSWEAAPYPPIFSTVDAVVVQSGHVLLIQRKAAPGKGLWAIPGGFVNQTERLLPARIRELKEETGIKVQDQILRRCIAQEHVFDDPGRSDRGRTITTAFYIKLDDAQDLPKVKGGDDAAKAKWFSFSEFAGMQGKMYDDHWHIINYFTKIV